MAESNAGQKAFWSEQTADKWLRHQDILDASFDIVLSTVLDAADLQPGHQVLDVGCGVGSSCLRAADRVGPEGAVLGLDISEPFLDRAQALAAGRTNVAFRLDDAQDAALPAGRFDRLVSRFGVMFFSDTTAAFANLARAMKPGGRMVMASWGQPAQNPWFMIPHRVAAERLGTPPKADRYAPGPFAFHDTEHTLGQIAAAGLDVSVEVLTLTLAETVDLDVLSRVSAATGPAGNIMQLFNGTDEDMAAIEAEIRARYGALAPGIPAEINLYTAICPGG